VYRNGEFLQESYLPDQTVTEVRNPDYAAVALGPDEYFVMGDNRPSASTAAASDRSRLTT
jgi:sarcosine oxidase gamma subunit